MKKEDAGYSNFSPFPIMFLKVFFLKVMESRNGMVKGQPFTKQF